MRYLAALALTLLVVPIAWGEPVKVWVAPFAEANEATKPDWINRALQQSLSDQLASAPAIEVASMPASTTEADAALAQQAKTLGVHYIVSGTVQRVNGELRVSGRVQDTQRQSTIGGFKATGTDRDLFALEDSVAEQVSKLIAPDAPPPPPVAAGQPATTAAAAPPVAQAPDRIETPFAPTRYGSFEGSDLQRAMNDRSPLYRERVYVPYESAPVYSTPLYPYTVGLNGNYPYGYGYGGYGYGGYGWGCGWGGWGGTSVVVVNSGERGNHHHDGGNNGGNSGGGGPRPTPVNTNGMAIRNAASYAGKAPPPGVVMTIGK